jgi:hypothetical protein
MAPRPLLLRRSSGDDDSSATRAPLRWGDIAAREHCQRPGSGRSASTCIDPRPASVTPATADPHSGSGVRRLEATSSRLCPCRRCPISRLAPRKGKATAGAGIKGDNGAVSGRIFREFRVYWVWFGFFAHGFRVRSSEIYRVRFRVWFFTRGYPMVTEISHYELKFMFYYILIIPFYLYTISS